MSTIRISEAAIHADLAGETEYSIRPDSLFRYDNSRANRDGLLFWKVAIEMEVAYFNSTRGEPLCPQGILNNEGILCSFQVQYPGLDELHLAPIAQGKLIS